MFTLSQMRDDLRTRLNQDATGSNLVWEDSEVDTYVRDGVFYVLDNGRIDLIQPSFTLNAALIVSGTALFTKPSNYYRFVACEIDGVYVNKLTELADQKFIETNDKLKGNSDRKYIYNYSGTLFEVRPSTSGTVSLHYLKELATTDFDSDSDVSPLTNIGDRYALQYANGLILQSKLYKTDVAELIFNRVEKQIR